MVLINPYLFLELCKENKDKLSESMKSYPIDSDNFEKWVKNHRSGTDARKVAEQFRLATRHVSIYDFFEKYNKICDDIIDYIYKTKYDQIVFYVDTENRLKKSNFWLALYMFPRLHTALTKNSSNVFIIDRFPSPNPTKKTLIIVPDDASYSGTQMRVKLWNAPKNSNTDFFIAVGYISNEAIQKIRRGFPDTKIMVSESIESFQIFRIPDNVKSKTRDVYTIYFDHKLPDTVSIYQLQYGIGIGFGTEHEFNYVPMSLIKGCETYKKVKENPYLIATNEVDVSDLQDYVKEGEMCPHPPYKSIMYTFRGKPIVDLDSFLMEEPKSDLPPSYDW